MKRHALIGMMIVGVLALNRGASGVFNGLQMVEHANVMTAAGPKKVYRIYALFTNGADRLTAWGGTAQQSMNLHTVGCDPVAFYQAPGGTSRAPSADDIAFNPDVEWDTFATIGVSINEQGVPFDQTQLSAGFPNFISATPYIASGLVFAQATTPQTRADFAGDGDPALRVLMMQLTTGPDAAPSGFISTLTWVTPTGQSNQLTQQHFFAPIEPPGRCCVPEGFCISTSGPTCTYSWNGQFSFNCEPCVACELTCLPDVAPHPGDGVINTQDLLAVIAAWGPHPNFSTVPADVSPPHGNDVVDVQDLLVVIGGWGECPPRK